MKSVVFNALAVNDLEEITHYLEQTDPKAAAAVREDILTSAEALGLQPGLGIRPRFSSPKFAGIRFLPSSRYSSYLLFYRELTDEVEVLRVLHGARNLPPLFET